MLACERVAERQEQPQYNAVVVFHRDARKRFTAAAITDIMQSRGPQGLIQSVQDWAVVAWGDAVRPTVRACLLSGEATAAAGVKTAETVVRKATVTFSFDEVDPNTIAAARNFRNNLITNVTADTAKSVQLVVADGIRQGKGPEWIAQRVRLVMGLAPRQAQALVNYANGLEARNKEMLARAVNPMLEAEIGERWNNDRPATAAQTNRLIDDYGARLLAQRASSIARTETLRAANLGAELSMRQARDEGLFGEFELRRFWLDTNDSKTRPDHREVPKLNPNGVALDEPFVYPGGRTIARPGDPNAADASMTANCRCTVVFRLVRRR